MLGFVRAPKKKGLDKTFTTGGQFNKDLEGLSRAMSAEWYETATASVAMELGLTTEKLRRDLCYVARWQAGNTATDAEVSDDLVKLEKEFAEIKKHRHE